MRFTPFLIYCPVCGQRFEVTANGGGYGRKTRCCSKPCHDRHEIWEAQSILGKEVQQ